MISAPDQVQIYELVMGDVNDDVTTVLEHARRPLKDNRLVPIGSTTSHPSYDTTRLAGSVIQDVNFNRSLSNEEGSGTDIVRYHVPITGVDGALRAFAKVYYQSMPPAWNAAMFSFQSASIDTFRTMLAEIDGTPTLVAVDSLGIGPVGIAAPTVDRISVLPNPTDDGWVRLTGEERSLMTVVDVFDARGRLVPSRVEQTSGGLRIRLPETPGLYHIQLEIGGRPVLKRVVRR